MRSPLGVVPTILLAACLNMDGLPSGPGLPTPPPPPPVTPPPPAPRPAGVFQVSASNLQGPTGSFYREPLVVVVVDSLGRGMGGIQVTWAVRHGAGEFGLAADPYGTPGSRDSQTDADGFARIHFRPTAPGDNQVVAEVPGLPLFTISFTASAVGPAFFRLGFGCLFDLCTAEVDPVRFPVLLEPLAVGTVVELVPWSLARVASVVVPPGGVGFDTGLMEPDRRYPFTLGATGEWIIEDVLTGGTGRITVR